MTFQKHVGKKLARLGLLGLCLVLLGAGPAKEIPITPPMEAVPAAGDSAPYIRVARGKGEDRSVAMEIAVRRLVPRNGKGPVIWLVGAIHLGTTDYYTGLQKFLDAQPLVLFEGVGKPPFMEVAPADDATRAARTRSAVAFAADRIDWYRRKFNAPPLSLGVLRQAITEHRKIEAKYLRQAVIDGWGRPIKYERQGQSYTLTSLGADGKQGGTGIDEDIIHKGETLGPEDEPESSAPPLQRSMADALGLVFQLDGIDYDREHFVNSDMSMRQVKDKVSESGGGNTELNTLMAALDGSSFLATVLRVGFKLIEVNPKLQAMVKAVLIEMLGETGGDVAAMSAGNESVKKLFQVIVEQRNQIVVDDVKRTLGEKNAPPSIAVFYGAAHMQDLERRLGKALGYKPVEQFWLRAFTANLNDAGLADADLKMFRDMVKAQMQMKSGR